MLCQGLSWVMEYLSGRCKDYGYRYTRPFAPSAHDIKYNTADIISGQAQCDVAFQLT